MFQETNDIGHYARVPFHIATAKIPSRARDVWILLAMNCTPESAEVWVRQPMLAEQLNCSTDTIGRVLRELVTAKLIFATNKLHQGRYKIYRLAWANLQEDVPQKCQNLNRVLIKQEQNIVFKKTREDFSDPESEKQKLLTDWSDLWKKRFGCLDGLSGRPSIEICVEQAMSHESRHKYASPKVWVEIWLQNAARQWLVSFNREQNAPATDPSLDAEAKVRRSQAETERSRRYYAQPIMTPIAEATAIPSELQAQVDKILAENETGFADKLMRLMKTQRQNQKQAHFN
jgi:hypothetical protein